MKILYLLFWVLMVAICCDGYIYEAVKHKTFILSFSEISDAYWISMPTCMTLALISYIMSKKEDRLIKEKRNKQLADDEEYDYINYNLTAINSHRRKSSSSWARTGILFKNKP